LPDPVRFEKQRLVTLINLVHINVDDRVTISVTRIDAERVNPGRNRFISNDHIDHNPDARGLAVVSVKFRERPAVSAAEVTKIAQQGMPQKKREPISLL